MSRTSSIAKGDIDEIGLTVEVSGHSENMFITQLSYSLEEILPHGDGIRHLGDNGTKEWG
jgi:hypothetical protein